MQDSAGDCKEFFDTLYSQCGGLVEMRVLGGQGRTLRKFFKRSQYGLMNRFALQALSKDRNVYFGVVTRDGNGGRKENLVSIPALWADIDFKETPEEAAQKALRDFSLKPSAIVPTGGGLHCYWVLKEPLCPKANPTAIPKIEEVNRRIAAFLGGDAASVDAARVLRFPGTRNFKYDPPRPVEVLFLEARQHELGSFLQSLPEARASVEPENVDEPSGEIPTALMECDFIRRCSSHPVDVKEPLWYALISNLVSVRPGGVSLCHRLSKGHPGYSPNETNRKILHALDESAPITCATIHRHGFACKKSCGVKSPVVLMFKSRILKTKINNGVQNVQRIKFQIE